MNKTRSYLMLGLIILFLFLISGCSTTVPVTAKFPEMPTKFMKPCEELQMLQDDAKLSDVAKTVTTNYYSYYDCKYKHDAMVEWYEIQKKIYEDIK